MKTFNATALALLITLGLQACSTINEAADSTVDTNGGAPQKSSAPTTVLTKEPTQNAEPDSPDEVTQYQAFPINTLYSLLAAELAASRQQPQVTLRHYIKQATETDNTEIIARAARIAQYFRAEQDALDMGLLWLKHQPQNLEALTLVANAYLELGQPIEAVNYTEQLLAHGKTDNHEAVAAFTETIANLSKKTDKKTTQQLADELSRLHLQYPKLVGIHVGLSILHSTLGDYTSAQQWIDKALQIKPDDTSALVQEIVLLQKTKQNALAINKLEKQLKKDPDNHRLRLLYARLLTQVDIHEAYKQFTLLAEQNPNQLDLQFSRALLALEINNLAVAKPIFDSLLTVNYRTELTHFYLGHIAELEKQPQIAIDHYQHVINGSNALTAKIRTGRLLIQLGQLKPASALFTGLRTQFPDKQAQLYFNESDELLDNDAFSETAALLETAVEQFPDDTGLRYNRSLAHEKLGNIALMESDLRHIIALEPNNVGALNGLGYFLAAHTDRFDEALQLISQALALRPQDAAIIDSMGWVAFKLGNIDDAIQYLEQAYAIFPDPEVAAHLGEALWSKGKKEKAMEIWKKQLENDPDSPHIIETIQRLKIDL